MFMLIKQHQLIKQDGAEGRQLAAVQPLDRHLPAPFEGIFEQPVERFDGLGAQFMEEPSDLHTPIGMWIGSPTGGHQLAVMQRALGAQRRRMVMLIAQDIAYVHWQFPQQAGGDDIIGLIGGGKLGGQRNPQPAEGHRQRQLPAISPAMPARLAPGRFGVDALV